MRTNRKAGWIAVIAAGALCAACSGPERGAAGAPQAAARPAAEKAVPLPPQSREYRTDHYAIFSAATPAQTLHVATAVEALHRAYGQFFALPPAAPETRLRLILYRDRAQFSAYNTSMPWAEAYYRRPYCHAYFAGGADNPYHWMLHEATHQLHTERAGFSRARWINEGVASYFGASRLEGTRLRPGSIDAGAYPIWWLPDLPLTGSLERDLRSGLLIPLRQLIDGSGPPIGGRHLNVYYLEYWSLSHFLFHHDGGAHAAAYRRLMRGNGSAAEFEAELGPIEQVQAQWYAYLLEKRAEVADGGELAQVVPARR
ncbi:hypothetical protein J5226_19310 [Lysobacter sp. K5869]|uniref:hypothetical protein n=1 Tax=Lysobacter sp. K5869 TaxID=2820808 RepID=UPI001C061C14|nr:hypothetical protein [Lysobacter sp. K5869]QWP75736.1 hypothetical protein J5226_19310 [Lysobacter sp. K5869]